MTTPCQESGTTAGNPTNPSDRHPSARKLKTLSTFSYEHDWSVWQTHQFIRAGHLKTVRVCGRQRITADAERAFDDAIAAGLLAQPLKRAKRAQPAE
jgi:hypothetical protein